MPNLNLFSISLINDMMRMRNCVIFNNIENIQARIMKIPLNDIQIIYEKLIADINVAKVSVVMFTALDVDALCTLKIISKLLKSQNIEYKVFPVSTYTQLEQKIQDCRSFEKVRLFFFFNCGGLIDLTSKWFSKQSQAFLFDVHKPIHHANIDGQNVKLIDDSISGFENAPTNYEMEMYQNMDDEFMEQLEQKNRDQSDSDQQIVAHKRKRVQSARKKQQRVNKYRKVRDQITQKIQTYYSNQFFGLPSSYLAYIMIKELNKHNNQYLWYAIVGITGNFLEQKISKSNFQEICEKYRSDMSKFNLTSQEGRQNMVQKNSLKRKLDFQFPVFRHWSLYESIMNSPYMVSKLALWEQTGISKMHEFLSRLGLSLDQCQQMYKFMSKDSIRNIQQNIFNVSSMERFNLLEITFDSFAKQVDYCVQYMASDYYYALIASLQAPMKKKMQNVEELLQHRVTCFWNSYSLFEGKQSALKESIQEYKKISTIITKEAKNIIERNHIMNGQSFSFVNFPSDTQDRKIFQHPFTLIKLAYMLMQMNKQKRRMKYYKPFIASLQNNQNNTSLMVGVMNDSKNSFSSKFNTVVQKLNVQVRIDSFMGNIMIVPKQSMVKVIRELGDL